MATPTPEERLFGRGILRENGDWRARSDGSIKTGTGYGLLRTRLYNRLLSGRDGWYHRPGEGITLQRLQGKSNSLQRRRELFNDLDRFREDPVVIDVHSKKVTRVERAGQSALVAECVVVTKEGEARFLGDSAFVIRGG